MLTVCRSILAAATTVGELAFAPFRRVASASGFRHCVYLGLKRAKICWNEEFIETATLVLLCLQKIKLQYVCKYVGMTLNVPLYGP